MTPKKLRKLRLPAMSCKMGDRGYLVTAMQMGEIAERVIEDVRLIHKSVKLAEWIQRELDGKHAKRIALYLKTEESRFFNALVLGVYGGDPQWAELSVTDPNQELTDEEEERINATVGVLILTGKEQLFAIDGQHRVAGIKRAVEEAPDLSTEEVTVILIGHAKTDLGMQRTRKLFVTLNQRAKKVSARDIVALDEDNGLAVVTRQIIDEGELFVSEELVAFSGSVAIPETKPKAITSILGLFQIIKALYPKSKTYQPQYKAVIRGRPEPGEIKKTYDYVISYWNTLIAAVPEYKKVMKTRSKNAGDFRKDDQNHLLFRPAGQNAMAKATECLVSREIELDDAVKMLVDSSEMSLFNPEWESVLWDPNTRTMLNKVGLAETILLNGAGQDARTPDAQKRLDDFREERNNESDKEKQE